MVKYRMKGRRDTQKVKKTLRKTRKQTNKTSRKMKYRGGDNEKSFFQEATDASCVLIPKSLSRGK